jgi:hypothetical protein
MVLIIAEEPARAEPRQFACLSQFATGRPELAHRAHARPAGSGHCRII